MASAPATSAPAPGSRRRPGLVGLIALLAVIVLVGFLPLRREEVVVTFTRGEVVVVDGDGGERPAEPGAVVPRDATLRTAPGASASLDLPDGHDLVVDGGSAVQVVDDAASVFGGPATEVHVESGRVRIGGETERGSLTVSTRHAVAGVRGTIFVVAAFEASTAFSQHQGVIAFEDAGGSTRELTPGTGAAATPAGADIRDLPAPPTLRTPAAGAIVLDSTTSVAWDAVPGAVDYLVELARDPDFAQIEWQGRSTGATSLLLPLLDEDRPVSLRVIAVDSDGLESAPSESVRIELRARLGRGLALQAAGDFAASVPEFEAGLPNYQTDPYILKELGWSLYVTERWQEARAVYERALAVEPGDQEALLEIGRVLFWLEEYDEAETRYRLVLAESPDDVDALWGLGEVLAATDRDAEAESAFLRTLQLDPDHPYAGTSLRRLREGG